MVGFGSAYRMSRRRGWEDAYFDYETLKLLLTQIEAVYEENTGVSGDGHYSFAGLNGFGSEDLFDDRYDHFDERLVSSNAAVRRQERKKQKRKRREKDENKHMDWRDELFLESDSSAAYASSGYDSEDDKDVKYIQDDDIRSSEDANFSFSYGKSAVVPSYGSSGSFVIGGGMSAASGTISNDSRTSLENRKNRLATGESQPILSHSHSHSHSEKDNGIKSGHGTKQGSAFPAKRKSQARKRRFGRRRNIPPHIRRSHEKARAITGRFLGLLRAEIDKVSLFVHSRMGELTDTIGSLRFPSDTLDFDEEYRHQLSDGGIHPSSSSSSEDSSSSSVNAGNDRNDMKSDRHIFPKRRRVKRGGGLMASPIMHQNFEDMVEKYSTKSTTLRQLSLAEHLRLTRPTFRSDQVLGEDFLLLSAVDEADAFTAVGVEFLHLLRFICVNSIAIRKLCKKHDRLLSNRMLGGYYQKLHEKVETDVYNILDSPGGFESTPRRKNTKTSRKTNSKFNDDRNTYGMLQRHHLGSNMLLGTYDSQVQALANSLVAVTLSTNLEVALAEFEISRRRADRLSSIPIKKSNIERSESVHEIGEPDNLCYGFPSPRTFGFASKKQRDSFKQGIKEDDEKSDAQSTSSSISLARLRFIVSSIDSLRRAAVENRNVFSEYLARSLLVLDGQRFIGEPQGMNGGCSRETLEFFASYNPDLILVLDPGVLEQRLNSHELLIPLSCNSVSADSNINFEYEEADRNGTRSNYTLVDSAELPPRTLCERFDSVALTRIRQLNLVLALISTMNYYVILPSAASYCYNLGWKHAHSALLIGIWNISALITMLCCSYYWLYLQSNSANRYFKTIFILASVCSLIGNVCYAKAYEYGSLLIALFGRLLTGLSSLDSINKHLIVHHQLHNDAQEELSNLKLTQIAGMAIGILTGCLDFEHKSFIIAGQDFILNAQTLPGYTMAFIWCCVTFFVLVTDFQVMNLGKNYSEMKNETSMSLSDHEEDDSKVMIRHPSESTVGAEKFEDDESLSNPIAMHFTNVVNLLRRSKRLVMINIAVPVTLFFYAFVCMTKEIVFTLSVIMGNRYFQWPGRDSGLVLFGLAILTIPVNLIVSHLNSW
eukprot:CAMPEP_0176477098 /NCGR_PEP_ID=MMETSP0200_2-20121128/426_1 /TAXON_ID=947934 /ORGANISM="Chaetoceros sp., Strain GSL56" /LENGTH=1108 /DNA_ID=CAMNT_0017872855 /DNA_START=1 /DNA_END=3324 /DNA_ORIENTATION=+